MKRVVLSWLPVALVMVGIAVFAAHVSDPAALRGAVTAGALLIALLALGCEFVDSTLGMGYGTALTPLLMFMGWDPLDVVPAVLISELATGLMAALLHHRAGNVSFGSGRGDLRVSLVLGGCSVLGALVAVLVAVSIPKFWLKLYVGLLVLGMGLLILLLRGREGRFSWRKVVGLGVLASFNKGMSGGGYGPVVTCGQILSGISGKRAVAITSLAEGLTCLVGAAAFVAVRGAPNWSLTLPLMTGALCSTPLAAWSVKYIPARKFTLLIGGATLLLGGLTLVRVLWR